MLLGVTTLGGDEPLGGWNIPERPAALFATTNFDLNTVVASPFCNVDLSGVILQLDTPLSTDQFERGQEFSDVMTGQGDCIALDAELTLPCFPDEIPKPPEVPGLVVPASYFLNAEFATYGVSGFVDGLDKVSPGDESFVTWINVDAITAIPTPEARLSFLQSDVIYLDDSLATPSARMTNVQTDIIYQDNSLSTPSARMTQIFVDVIYT